MGRTRKRRGEDKRDLMQLWARVLALGDFKGGEERERDLNNCTALT